MASREQAALELLRRIYEKDGSYDELMEDGMVVDWIDRQIGAFIREFGAFSALKENDPMADLLSWLEEEIKSARHVEYKLEREAEDFNDGAYNADAERFRLRAKALEEVAARINAEKGTPG